MNLPRETRTGWAISLAIHGGLLVLFLLISIPDVIQRQEFIEVTWGLPAVSKPARATTASASAGEAGTASMSAPKKPIKSEKPSQTVILPERRMVDRLEDNLPLVRSEKIELAEKPGSDRKVTSGVGEREPGEGRTPGAREQTGPASGIPGSSVGPEAGSGGLAGDVDKGVSFSIQWMEGGTRGKISGELPQYPEGVNVVAQIKILALVAPDGSIKSAQPAQKGNTRLEEAAMKQVRLWKFEPLRSSQPQDNQSCVVTFLFTLK